MRSIILLSAQLVVLAFGVLAERQATRIGVSSALTGNAASYGNDIKNFLLFANQRLAGGKYELIFEDDKCSGKDAVTVAHKLINVDKVKHVLGFACSSTLLSAAPLYEKAQVLAMSSSAAAPDISQAGDYIFRTWQSDIYSAKFLYDYISQRHKKVGMLSEETDYALGFAGAFKKANEGGDIRVYDETFLTEDTDFRSLLLNLKNRGIEGLFINTQTERTYANVLRQIRQMKLDIPLYGAYMPGSSTFLELVGDLANGIIFIDPPTMESALTEEGKAVFKEFVAQYGKPQSWDFLFAVTYEAFRAMHGAIESGMDHRKYLYSTKFDGIFGKYWFDGNGDIQGMSMAIKVIDAGTVKTLPS